MSTRSRSLRDSWAAAMLIASANMVAVLLVWILADIGVRGVGELSFAFLVEAPREGGRAGGIGTILVATGLLMFVCLAVSLPIGIGAGAWLAECRDHRGALQRFLRRSLDALAAVPSIVFGLFGNALFCHVLGLGYSIWSGGLTLACMILPWITRTTEQALRSTPPEYRLGAAALGMSRTTTLLKVLLPAAAPGIGAGVVLGLGRAVSETAALIFTAGYVTRMPESLFDSGRALSVHIYDLALNVPGGATRAYGTALVLVVLLLAVNVAARILTRPWLRQGALA